MLRHRHNKPPRLSRRGAELGDAAAHLGLQFTPEDHLHLDRLPFTFFKREDVRQVANTAWGTVDGMSVWVWDAWLKARRLPGGGPQLTCIATVVTAGFPTLAVVGKEAVPPARGLDELGLEPYDVEGDLAARFEVHTADKAFADDLLQPEMVEWLAEGDARDRYELSGPYLVLAVPTAVGDDLEGLLTHVGALRSHLPPGLAARYPPSATAPGPTVRNTGLTRRR